MPAETVLKWRRGTAAEWELADPVLAAGEPGYETDTNQFKIGDGSTQWTLLPYQNTVGPTGPTGPGIEGVTATAAEINYLVGVTDYVQDQLSVAYKPPFSYITSNAQIYTPGRYFVNTTAAITLTLPEVPTMGDEIQIFDVTGTAGTYNITVENNGKKINGLLDSALLDIDYVIATFTYTNSATGWRMR